MICVFRVFAVLAIATSVKATVNRNDVTFYLFTENDRENCILLDTENAKNSLQKDGEIIFLIHGWTQNRTYQWYEDLKNALLFSQGKTYNVIEVDWSKPAAQSYFASAKDTPLVGEIIADFIITLVNQGIPLKNIHLCGHSLGGQVAGFAGKYFIKKTLQKLPRITALDPAGPFFQRIFTTPKQRLDRHDADVVFVIHTDRTLFGVLAPCGTIDVFPNGGAGTQPGCPDYSRGETLFCSHHKSYEYYTDALENPGTLIATECYSYSAFDSGACEGNREIDLAGDFTRNDDGNYYLNTGPTKPFGNTIKYY